MRCRAMYFWILVAPAVAQVAPVAPVAPVLLTENRTVPIQVSCGFDVSGVALSAGKLGTSLYKVEKNCKNPKTDREKRKCASQVTTLLAFAGITATFTASAASDCAASLNEPAKCAVSTSGFAAILMFVSSAMIALKGACIENLKGADFFGVEETIAKLKSEASPRRLRSNLTSAADLRSLMEPNRTKVSVPLKALPGNPQQVLDHELFQKIRDLAAARETRQVKIADCFFDAGLAALFFGRGIMNTILAAERSPCDEMDYGDDLEEKKVACLIQVSGITAVFLLVGVLVAASVSVCPVQSIAAATCAKDILAVIGGLTALIQEGAAIHLECGQQNEDAERLDEDLADDIVA